LSQTYSNFELIVVDDASSDNTEATVRSFQDERIRYLRQEANRGVSAARNHGIEQSRGRFITFLDDDDESYPDLLAATFQTLSGAPESVGFVWSGFIRVQQRQGEERVIEEGNWPRDIKRTDPLVYLIVGTGYGLTVRRSCFDAIGLFDESLHSSVDLDLLIRLEEKFDFMAVPGIHVKVYTHSGGQLTDVTIKRVTALEQVIEKNAAILHKRVDALVILQDEVVAAHYRLNNKLQARLGSLKMIGKAPLRRMVWGRFLRRETNSAKRAVKKILSTLGLSSTASQV
jgi:glycosyltransferase involved in cell wall biosynthesis